MSGVAITIRVGGDAPKRLRAMLDAIEDKATFFAAASELMLDQTMNRFAGERGPDGEAWEELSAVTVAKRGSAHPILQRSGQLRGGIHAAPEAARAVVRTLDLPYAAIHQEGGEAGRGHEVDIPARPYLGFGDDDVGDLVELAEGMLLR